MRTLRRLSLTTAATVLATLLAACSQAPAATGTAVGGKLVYPGSDPKVQGVAFVMADPGSFATAALTEVYPGIWSSEIVLVNPDDTFRVPLPSATELPAAVLSGAEDFFSAMSTPCPLTASSATARVSNFVVLPAGAFPSVWLFSMFEGGPSIASDVAFDEKDPSFNVFEHPVINWLYATEDVSVATATAGCLVDGVPVHVAYDLKAGWNQVRMDYGLDPSGHVETATLTNDDTKTIYFNYWPGAFK